MYKNAAFQSRMHFTEARAATGKKAQITCLPVYRTDKDDCQFSCSDIQVRFSLMNKG